MGVVPGVVINKDGSVTHSCNLITVIPPWKDFSIFLSVHLKPVISLTIIINNDARAILPSACHDNWRRRICLSSHVCRVINIAWKEVDKEQDDYHSHISWNATLLRRDCLLCTALALTLLVAFSLNFLRIFNLILFLRQAFTNCLWHLAKNLWNTNGSENAGSRCDNEHETDHNAGEVGREDSIQTEEEFSIGYLVVQTEVESDWDKDHQILQVEEVAAPWGRLMLRHWGDDGDVLLGIGWI